VKKLCFPHTKTDYEGGESVKKLGIAFVVMLLVAGIFTCQDCAKAESEASKEELIEINTRKAKYAKSAADIFMSTIDDVMYDELVRSVISESDEQLLAKMLWGEDRQNPMYMRAAVIWCVFNRLDAWNVSVEQSINKTQFSGYSPYNPVEQWAIDLIRDVAVRYALEKNGFDDVGRTLPKRFLFFEYIPPRPENIFKVKKNIGDPTNETWDWSLPSPY